MFSQEREMVGLEEQYYEIPSHQDADHVQRTLARILTESRDEVQEILARYGVPPTKAQEIAEEAVQSPPEVRYEGSGSVAATVAICVALTRLVKVLIPLVEPFSKEGAELAHEIGLDIWKLLRKRLLENESVRLTEKPHNIAAKA
jgi:hypothetical protein